MILFCFISLLGTASAEEIIDNNIASNDASIDIDVIESPIHEDISISTVKNSDVSTDDSLSVNGSASKGKLTANKLSQDYDLSVATVDEIKRLFDEGIIQSGDTLYLGNQDISSTWSQWDSSKVITVNVGNIIISGGSSTNPDGTSTINANEAKLFNVQASGVTFTNIKFTNSQGGDGPGAAIALYAADCTIQNCEFDGCQVKRGAAIYGSSSASNTQITNCNFTNNVGRWGGTGGAIYLEGSGCKITDSNFDGNTADSYGAIYSDSDLDITNCNFTNSNSGTVYIYGDSEIQDCNFAGNTGNSAVHIDGTAKVSNSNFTNNVATNHNGGALYIYGENSVVDNCNFNGNSLTTDYNFGGALYLDGANSVVNNSKFDSNNGHAAAISVEGSDITIENSEFTNNVAPSTGGAIYVNHDNVVIKNSNFTDNSASTQGGAIFIADDCHNADMTGCNFTGNTAGSGTAIYCAGTGDGKVTDCDFGVKPELNVNNGYPVLTLTLESDYAGIIVGNIEGGPSGGSTVPEANETITLEIFDSEGTLVATVTNKTDENGQMKYDYSHLPRGNYTYKATYMDGQTKEGPLNMGVVEGDNFSAIQAAINAAEPGSVIFLEGKTYYNDIQGTMTINKPITIIGTDGTVLDAENISRIFTIADNIDNVNLNNITFINGFVEDGDGGAIYVSQGSDNLNLVNCNFTNNHATGENSHGGALFIGGGANNGNIINTTFDNNTAYVDGGAIRNDGGWGWNIYDTSFTNNSAVHDADSDDIPWGGGAIWTCNAPMTIYNSNFTDNNGTYGGAIRGAVSTYECLFDNNTATNGNGGAIDVTTDRGLYDQIDLEFVNTTFVNNDAKGSRGQDRAQGGGIHIYHLKEIDMYGCYCENNTADRGGAIDFYELERTHVENCTILNNNASSEGGGMAIFCNQSTFKDTNVSNNNAGTDGGAIWVIGHNALFDNITSINNTAERGGSSFINGSDTVIVNCNITNNTAVFNPSKPDDSGLGGAIDVIGDNCRIINLTSEDNNAYRGGSTFIRGDNTVVYNSTFDNNNADLRGGGLNIAGNGVIVENVTANNNNASLMGGGIYVVANGTQFKNITADNNQAERGGGAFIEGNDVTVDIGDFSNNRAIFNESNVNGSGLGGALDIAGNGCNITNVNSTNNQAYRGGSTFIRGDNTFVANCTFDNNNATLRGGGLNIAGDGVIVENVTANNNNASLMGGGIYVVANGTQFKNITADNNQAERGGGAFIEGNDVTIDIGDFNNNKAIFNESNPEYSGLGGALDIAGNGCNVTNVNSTGNTAYRGGSTFIRGNDTHVENCKLDDNNATLRGGGLNIAGDRCTIDTVEINNNNAGTMGGGIYVVSNGTTFTNIIADNNQAERGGAAFINGTNILVQHGELSDNLARFNESKVNESGLGGGFDIVGDNVLVDDVHSNNNQAYRGGSTFIRGENVTVQNCNLDNNNATVRGGALNIGGGDNCKVINVSVSNNHAGEDGGAIYVIGNYSLFDNVNSTNNTAERGGSSFVAGDYINVTNCNLNNNNATIRGGGLDVAGDHCLFENVTLSNCHANEDGGAAYVAGDYNTFTNVTSENNTAENGGSTYIVGDHTTVQNSNVKNNTAENAGGGIFIDGDYALFLNNNITFNNAVDPTGEAYNGGGGIAIQALFANSLNFTNNNISSNHAKDNGGGVFIFTLDGDIIIDNVYAYNNTAENGGFCHVMMADNLYVTNSTFDSNHATGDIFGVPDRGEGGAFHISSTENAEIEGDFYNNTAMNGSAIYVESSYVYVHDSTFFDNQAHSYYLIVLPEENTTYNKGEDVVIKISHIGGDNIANAIHNRDGESDIVIRNITYPFYNDGVLINKTISPDEDVRPVEGYENSDNGNLIYLDDLEDNQVIYYEIFNKDTNESVINLTNNRSDISGSVTLTLKGLEVGNYTVRAHYLETTYYTAIANETVFRVIDSPANMTVNKTSLNRTDIILINDTVGFNITVNNTGDINLYGVNVTEIFNSTELEYINHSNNQTWIKIGDSFIFNGTKQIGDLIAYTINLRNNGDCTLDNITISNVYDPTELEYVKGFDYENTAIIDHNFFLNLTLDVSSDLSFTLWFKTLKDDFKNMTPSVTYDIVEEVPGTEYNPSISIEKNFEEIMAPLHVNETSTFTIWFKALTNGTLVNNVTAKSNETNETNDTANVTVYKPNMTVQKIANDNITYVGNTTSFTIVVTNTGDCNLTDVVVTDTDFTQGLVYDHYTNSSREWTYDGRGHWTLVNGLENGTSANFTVYFNVTTNGTLVNNVSAVSNLTNETNGTNQTRAYLPNMTVQKIANDNVTYVGNTTSFTIVVTNTGDCNLNDVVVTDTDFTQGLVYDHYTNSSREWTYDGNGHWTLVNPLLNGTSANFTVFFNVTVNGTLVNNVSAKSNLTNETNGTNQTRAYLPNMTVQKIANDKVVYVGNTTSFDIIVTNTGDCNLSEIVVTDEKFSSGLLYKEYKNTTGLWNKLGNKYTLVGDLAPGASASFTIFFDVIDNGTLVNNVSAVSNLTNETNGTNNTTAYRPNMTVQKIANDDLVYVGNTTSFTIVVTNTGDCNLSSVVVTDKDFSTGLRYKDYTNGSRQWIYDGDGHWTLDGILTNGSSANFTVIFDVISNGTLVNNVSAKSNLTNETNGTNNTTAKAPNMTVQKISLDKIVPVGTSARFEIVVTNTGDCELSDVYVIDTDHDEGLVYLKYENGTRNWTNNVDGRWDLVGALGINQSASFIIYFNVTANGTLVNNVTAGSNLTNETNGTNSTSSLVPNMTVQKIANDNITYIGNVTSFTIVVRNTGEANLTNIVVSDTDYSEGLVFNGTFEPIRGEWTAAGDRTWSLGFLEVGDNASFTLYFNVTANGTLVNNVSAHSDLTNETNGTNETKAYAPNMTVQKIANDNVTYVGNTTSFTIVVTNTGDCNLTDVVVTDTDFTKGLVYDHYTNSSRQWTYDGAGHWTLVNGLENGTSANFTVFFNVTVNGTLVNNVSAKSNLTNETNGTNQTRAYLPNMTVQKIANDKVVYVGNTTSFTIVVTNTGDCNLSDVVVTDKQFSSGLRYKEYTNGTGRWNYNEANKTWTLVGSLENGTSASFTVVFDVIDNGTLVNNVSAISNLTNETNGTNNTTAYRPNMTVQKIANDDVVYVGNTTSFDIIVTNTGDCNLSSVIVTDKQFSSGLRYKDYTNGSRQWTYDGEGQWTLVGILTNGSSASFTVVFDVIDNGTLVNNVSAVSNLTNETNGTNNTTAYRPNMTVQKIANDDVVYVGNTTSFDIIVTNTGDCNLSSVIVTDKQFSSGLRYKDYTNGSRQWTYDGEGQWTLVGILTNGSSASFTVIFDVIDNGTLVNNVSAVSNLTNETNGTNNTTSYRPNMTVQKIANDKVVYVGNITSFTIVVTNTGDCNLSDVVVTDKDFSSGLRYKEYTNGTGRWNYNEANKTWTLVGSLENGTSASFTVVFDVIDNGTLVNNVSAVSNLTNETNGTNNTTAYRPNMTVQKIANDDVVYVGNTTSFDIIVTNTGDCNLSSVIVTDKQFSSGLRYKDYTNGSRQWTYDGEGQWTLVGILTNGSSASFTVVFDVIDNGTLVNNVSAVSNLTNETNGTNNTTAYRPNMTVQKIANDKVVYVGNTTSFDIVVTNTGDCNLSDVVVTDKDFSSGLRYKEYTNGTGRWNYNEANKTWTLVGSLENGTSASFTVVFDVIDNGTLVNNVSAVSNLTNETNGTNNTTAYRPNMTVQKIANDDLVYVGNITSFTIIVTNTGDCNLSEIVVTDKDFSSGLRYKEYTNGTGRWNYNEANKTWTLVGSLENGTSADFTVFFEVISNGTLVNNVSASSNLTNETNGTNNTTAKAPNMTVQKISIDKVVPVGNSSRFEIVVTNTGDCELSDIYVIDTDHDEGLVYLKYENGTRTWNYDGNGRWDLVGALGIDQSASFIIYFNVTANGTLRNNVTAGSNLTNETNGTNETTSLVPNMTIEKIANQKVTYVGNTTSFTIIVRNNGEANLTNILVTDKDYSEGLVFNGVYEPVKGDWTYNGDNTWSLASLNVGEDASFTVYFNVTLNGTLVNNASAHSDLTNETNATNDTRAYQPNLTVRKITYNEVVYVGEHAIFTIMVYNTGDCELSNVTVKETWFSEGLVFDDWVPNGNYLWDFNEDEMTWTMKGILPPFENNIASLVVFFNVTQNGTLKNNVSASSNLTNETNSSNETHAYDPKMTIEKIANDDVVYVGNTTSFTIVVRNTGDCELSEIVVTDDKYSDGLEYSKYENGSRLWNYVDGKWKLVGSLAPGESADFTVFFTVISNGTLNNTASAVSNLTNETNSTNNTTAYKPNITVLKIANDDVVYVGNVTSFTILVINTGDCDLSGIYVIDDDYSDGLKYNRYENGTGKWTYDGERFTLVGDLAAGESADFTVFFDVVENGTLVNNVSAGSNLTNETNNTNNTTAKPVCDVIIYKEVNTTECLVGDLVEWTITVVNVGPSTALDVIVKDVLSNDLELVSANSTSYNNATGEWTVGDLKVNTPVSLTLVTRVLASGTIYNNATVNTTTDESNYTNNNASNKTDAKVLCDLVITKAVNQSSCNVSDIIQWNITVTNLGPHSASDVIVKDLIPDGLELISYNVSIGNFNDVISEWSIGTLDKDQVESLILVTKVLVNGTIVNIATVNTTTPDLDYTNNEANNTTVAENICDLEVIKIVNSKKVYIGDLLTWTIRVTNNGPSEALDVCVSDILPEGLIFVNYKATTGKYDDVSGTWTVGKLASGSSATLDLITRIDELGNITNPVSVNTTTPESNYSNNKANNTTEAIPIVDLVLDKSSDKAKYNVNDTMHWIIKVTNRGPCDAIDAYVLDVLPKGTKFISYEATKGTYDETTGVWSIGDIANGEEVSIDILCKALLSGNFTNNATVYNNVTDTNTSNNYDNSTVEIIEDTPEPGPNPNPEPVPDEPIPNEPPVTTMLKTGNPLVVLLLALIAMAGTLGLRRRKE